MVDGDTTIETLQNELHSCNGRGVAEQELCRPCPVIFAGKGVIPWWHRPGHGTRKRRAPDLIRGLGAALVRNRKNLSRINQVGIADTVGIGVEHAHEQQSVAIFV